MSAPQSFKIASSADSPGYELFTSLRYDTSLLNASFNTHVSGHQSPYLLFPYHLDRLIKTATDFGWTRAIQTLTCADAMQKLKQKCDEAVEAHDGTGKTERLRLRIMVSIQGETRVKTYPARPLTCGPLDAAYFNPEIPVPSPEAIPSPVLEVYLDTTATPSSEFTSYKTTNRNHYEAARARVGLKDWREPREVVLYNEHGEVTEGSYRNVAFWRNGGWVSPSDSSGGLPGTVRRWMLENGMMREQKILVGDVRPGEWVLMSNSIEATILGKVVDSRQNGTT